MSDVVICPDAATLQRFLLGQEIADDVEVLERHIEHCERCVSTLCSMQSRDSVVDALQAGSIGDATSEDETLRKLADRLKTLQSNATEADTNDLRTESLYDFLAPADNPAELGRLGHYQVHSVLGSGGMGVVFKAFDRQLDRYVALKAMLSEQGPGADHGAVPGNEEVHLHHMPVFLRHARRTGILLLAGGAGRD